MSKIRGSILFFVEGKWAFGQIHHALIKRLWTKNIYAHLFDWSNSYSLQEVEYLKSKYDAFVTIPCGAYSLMSAGVPASKIIVVAHHEKDISQTVKDFGVELFETSKGFGVIHESMQTLAAAVGIKRIPKLVLNGVDFDHFYSPISDRLEVIGYGTAVGSSMSNGTDFKRGYLAPRVTDGMGLDYVMHEFMNHLCMPGYYRTMDALLVTSSYEGCGLPAMEAAAAGRLVIGAKAGYFTGESGFLCRTSDDEFVEDARKALLLFKNSPEQYRSICEKSQQYARDHYDWEHTVDGWIELFGY